VTIERSDEYLIGLLAELRKLPRETEWVEFKRQVAEPEEIGEYISALANGSALSGKMAGYLVWGVDDQSHDIVGTTFNPAHVKIGNEELENWLLRLLNPRIEFRFFRFQESGQSVVMLEIGRAFRHPVQFRGQEFVRVGSYKKKLKEFPEKERTLWRIFDATPLEDLIAAEHVDGDAVLHLLDYPAYFELLKQALPESKQGILASLAADGMIVAGHAGKWNIKNLGAILLAKRLDEFRDLRRKAVRVVVYKGADRLQTVREQVGGKGYAAGFAGLIEFVNTLLPTNEVVGQALRKTVPMYPEIAVRELVANALIHQDFFVSGTGPMVEIFGDRMEITNPGKPLVETDRFLDSPPRSRNETLASFMRRIGVCEERGSGVDKVVFQAEYYQLPAPLFEVAGDNTRATLFAHRSLSRMSTPDRIRACYLHACLRYVQRDTMTNSSLRVRFGISEKSSAIASRIIKEALDAGTIRPLNPDAGKKFMKYVPFWA
jgi:ATP-dependent DNA helicase RecG